MRQAQGDPEAQRRIHVAATRQVLSGGSRTGSSLLEDAGIALHGSFISDPDGVPRYWCVHDNNIARSADETRRMLQALRRGDLCPVNWQPGEETLG